MDKLRRGSGNCPSESLPEQQSPPHRLPLPSSCFSLAGVLRTGDNAFLKWLGIRQEKSDCNPRYSEDEAAGSLSLTSSRSVWALWWDLVSKQKQLRLEILEESNDKNLSNIVLKRNTPAMSLTSPFLLSFFLNFLPAVSTVYMFWLWLTAVQSNSGQQITARPSASSAIQKQQEQLHPSGCVAVCEMFLARQRTMKDENTPQHACPQSNRMWSVTLIGTPV